MRFYNSFGRITAHYRGEKKSPWFFLLFILISLFFLTLLIGCTPEMPISTTQLRAQMNTLLNLHSYEYLYREILYLGERQRVLGFIPTKDRQFLFKVDFLVSAGIDLKEGYDIQIVSTDPMGIHLTLPDTRILSVDALEETIQQYLGQTFGGELQILELGDLLELAADSITKDAEQRGILHQAKAEAESLLRTFFSSMGIQEISIQWGGVRE